MQPVSYHTRSVKHDTFRDIYTDTFSKKSSLILILDTLLILRMNTKCKPRSEHTEYCENPKCLQEKHQLVYEMHLNSNTVPLSSQDHEIYK